MTFPLRQLGELIEVHDNLRKPLSGKERSTRQGPFPYYGAQGIIDWIDAYRCDGKYLLVPEDGENLRSRKLPIALAVEGQFWVNNHAHVLRARPSEADQRFLKFAIEATDIGPFVTGAAQPKLSQENLRKVPVPAPFVHVQARVADVLAAFDDLIENNRRRIEILEETARSLYQEWFVRYRFPGHESVEFVDSDVGLVPSTWRTRRLGDLANLRRENIKPGDYPGELFSHCSVPAFDAGRLPVIEPGASIKSGKYLIESEVVLLSKLNPRIPRVWLAEPSQSNRTVCSTEFLPLAPRSTLGIGYLYGLLTSDAVEATLQELAGGTSTSHQRAKPDDVMAVLVVVPPSSLITAFESAVLPILHLARSLRFECQVLKRACDALLPRLVTGQIEVDALGVADVFEWEEAATSG